MSWTVAALLIPIALAGCSSVPTYPNTAPKNMQVTTRVDSGSGLGATVAEFDVHRVNARCGTENQGRVYLDNGTLEVGIPVDETLYLDFIFASKGFLSPSVSATRYSTLLTPRSGYEYRAEVTYNKGLYGVRIREFRKGASSGREIERVPLSACKPRG